MDESNEPEIMKMHLGSAVLNLMALGVKDVTSFDFIEPPNHETLIDSMKTLRMLGALTAHDTLTIKGQQMSKIPLEPRAACMALNGIEAGYEQEAITLAAVSTFSSNFYIRVGDDDNKKLADEAKIKFCKEEGDIISMVDVFNDWKTQGKERRNKWCVQNHLNAKTMRSINDLTSEIKHALKSIKSNNNGKKCTTDKQFSIADAEETGNNDAKERRTALINMIIVAYYDNIAFYTGHSRIGYLTPKHKELFVAHPSSVLCTLAMEPEVVIFQDVLKTSCNFLIGLTPVSADSIRSLCPHPDFAIDWNECVNIQILNTTIAPFGQTIIKSLIGKRGETVKELTRRIKEGDRYPGLLEISLEQGKVVIYTTQARTKQAIDIVRAHINPEVSRIENQGREEEIGGSTRTGHRVFVKSGGEIQGYLHPNHIMEMKLQVLIGEETNDSVFAERIRCEVLKSVALLGNFKSLQPSEKCYLDKNTKKTVLELGTMCFSHAVEIKTATETLARLSGPSYEVLASPQTTSFRVDGEKRDASGNVEVIISWPRRLSRGFGFILASSPYDREKLLTNYSLLPQGFSYLRDKNNAMQILVRNIPITVGDQEFRKMLEGLCYSIVTGGEQGAEEVSGAEGVSHQCKASLVYEKAVACDLVAEVNQHNNTLTAELNGTKVLSLHVFPIQKQGTTQCRAKATFGNLTDAENACHHLKASPRVMNGRCVFLKAEIKKNTRIFCKKVIYDSLFEDIKAAEEDAKTCNVTVYTADGKSKDTKMVHIAGTDSFIFTEISTRFQQLLKGEEMTGLNVTRYQFDLMKREIASKEKLIGRVKCEFDARLERFWIYGLAEQRELLKKAVEEIHGMFTLHEARRIDLRGDGKAPGLMKALIIKFGVDLKHALATLNDGFIKVNIRQHSITISAAREIQEHVLKLVDECNAALLKSKNQTTQQDNDTEDLCNLCFCEVDAKRYRLELCGHLYCNSCLQQFLESSTRDRKFPITCCKDDCEKALAIKDIDVMVGRDNGKRKAMTQAAIANFITMNSTAFKYCLTPDCPMIYRVMVEPSEFNCPLCKKVTCTKCGKDHQGYNCQGIRKDLEGLSEWVKTNDAKKCPKCGNYIEKNGGCMHVACKCGAHICWRCLKDCETADKCYKHLGTCGGIFR